MIIALMAERVTRERPENFRPEGHLKPDLCDAGAELFLFTWMIRTVLIRSSNTSHHIYKFVYLEEQCFAFLKRLLDILKRDELSIFDQKD